jgi:hypothetical protein
VLLLLLMLLWLHQMVLLLLLLLLRVELAPALLLKPYCLLALLLPAKRKHVGQVAVCLIIHKLKQWVTSVTPCRQAVMHGHKEAELF